MKPVLGIAAPPLLRLPSDPPLHHEAKPSFFCRQSSQAAHVLAAICRRPLPRKPSTPLHHRPWRYQSAAVLFSPITPASILTPPSITGPTSVQLPRRLVPYSLALSAEKKWKKETMGSEAAQVCTGKERRKSKKSQSEEKRPKRARPNWFDFDRPNCYLHPEPNLKLLSAPATSKVTSSIFYSWVCHLRLPDSVHFYGHNSNIFPKLCLFITIYFCLINYSWIILGNVIVCLFSILCNKLDWSWLILLAAYVNFVCLVLSLMLKLNNKDHG